MIVIPAVNDEVAHNASLFVHLRACTNKGAFAK